MRLFYGWWIAGAALMVKATATGLIVYSYSVIVGPFGKEFTDSRFLLMSGLAATQLVSAIASPPFGAWLDRTSIRRVIALGAGCLGGGFFLISAAGSIWHVILSYTVAMAAAMVLLGTIPPSALISRWFVSKRGRALGVAALGTSIGGAIFPPLIQFLIAEFDWRVAYRIMGMLVWAIIIPLTLWVIVDHPSQKSLYPDGSSHPPGGDGAGTADTTSGTTADILRNPNFWLIGAAIGGLFSAFTGVISNLALFATDLGITGERAAVLLSVLAICGMAGKVAFGVIADNVDLRLALAVAMILLIGGLACFLGASAFVPIAIGSGLVGLSTGGMIPVWGALIAEFFGVENYGRAMGLMTPCGVVPSMLAPLLAGLIHDLTDSYRLVFIVFMALLVGALTLVPFIRSKRQS